jgi:hypothetical protein
VPQDLKPSSQLYRKSDRITGFLQLQIVWTAADSRRLPHQDGFDDFRPALSALRYSHPPLISA